MSIFSTKAHPFSMALQSAVLSLFMAINFSTNAASAPYNPNKSVDKKEKSHKPDTQRRRDWREDRRKGYGDWSNPPTTRRVDRRRDDRHDNRRPRRDRWDRYTRRHDRSNDYYRQGYRRNNYRRNHFHDSYNPYNNYTRRYNSRGYHTRYRSSLGINFFFGLPNFSSYRWASTPYSFYQPGHWSYASYRSSVQCSRIMVEANHYDHIEIISVKECYNPLDGYYIIQGSERVVDCIRKD